MAGYRGNTGSHPKEAICAILAGFAGLFLLAAPAATQERPFAAEPAPLATQQPSVPPEAAPPEAAPPPAQPAFKPGFIDALGHWLGQGRARIGSQLKSTQDAIGDIGSQATSTARDAASAAQQATGAIVSIPGTRIVTGHQRCTVASNGGADCTGAIEALCRKRGFETGRELDIHSAQKCPTWVWLSGRQPVEGTCPTETFVTRAICN